MLLLNDIFRKYQLSMQRITSSTTSYDAAKVVNLKSDTNDRALLFPRSVIASLIETVVHRSGYIVPISIVSILPLQLCITLP